MHTQACSHGSLAGQPLHKREEEAGPPDYIGLVDDNQFVDPWHCLHSAIFELNADSSPVTKLVYHIQYSSVQAKVYMPNLPS